MKAGSARFFSADALITMRQKCSKNPTAFGFLELFLIFEGEFCAKRPFARIKESGVLRNFAGENGGRPLGTANDLNRR